MLSKISQWVGIIGIAATMPLVQTMLPGRGDTNALAKTSVEIAKTAKAITVLITGTENVGSGVILQRQGEIYTVLTAAHVLTNKAKYTITTPDDRKYEVISSSIRSAPGSIDLAVVKFKSTTSYPTAKLGNSNVLQSGMDLYVAGFPGTSGVITESIFVFTEGKVLANSNKIFDAGYSLVYGNDTVRGMSGGAVLNSDGELVAIHGRGDREKFSSGDFGSKTGFNLGIPINRFATVATKMGVELNRKVAPIPTNIASKADDYIALAVQKSDKQDYRGSLADFDRAIQLAPNYAIAYKNRGNLKADNLQDLRGGLADLNRAIQLAPNDANAYNDRGNLKADKLQDLQGGLADLNRAIQLYPYSARTYANRGFIKADKLQDLQGGLADLNRAIQRAPYFAYAYNGRGFIKVEKLQDLQGGLADYNRAIQLAPYFAIAYYNRGLLKHNRLNENDRSGGVADLQQAARLFKQQGNTAEYQKAIGYLKKFEGQNSQPIVTKPSNAEGYYRQGDQNADAGNYRQAIVDFSRSIAIDTRSARAYIGRGRSKYQLQDYPGAISDYNKALSIDPRYASAYYNLGLVKAKSKDIKGAISDMQQAVKLYQQQGKQQDAKDAVAQIAQWKKMQANSGF